MKFLDSLLVVDALYLYNKYIMKIFISILIGLLVLLSLYSPIGGMHQSFVSPVSAASASFGSAQVQVGGQVGEYTLSLQGYLAPFASIVLQVDGTILRSTVADTQGYFSISSVLIKSGFDHFCLDGVDFKRLGQSEACFTVAPATGSIAMANIFLPPTLGVFRSDVNVGDKALVWGYGMPGATINVHMDNQLGCATIADTTGYYQCNILIAKSGTHSLYADSVLKGKSSETQLKRVLIAGLTFSQQIAKTGEQSVNNVWNLLTNLPGGIFVLLVLLLIILIIILLKILKPHWFSWLPEVGLPKVSFNHSFDFLFKERRLHHWWMEGVGY